MRSHQLRKFLVSGLLDTLSDRVVVLTGNESQTLADKDIPELAEDDPSLSYKLAHGPALHNLLKIEYIG